MNITIASTSNQGGRASNQDQTGEVLGNRAACFVVCDGIAGFPAAISPPNWRATPFCITSTAKST